MTTIVKEIYKYLDNLTATNPICVSLGTTLSGGSNLFMMLEPADATQCITIIPYGGGRPNTDKNRFESSVQIRLKTSSRQKALETMQSVIENLHMNDNVCASMNGLMMANQSLPIIFDVLEGGKYIISISNFSIIHTK